MLIHHNVVFSSTFARAERRHEGAMATWHRRRQAGGRTKVWREGRKSSVYIGGLGCEINRPDRVVEVGACTG